jgi:hypothetical protein
MVLPCCCRRSICCCIPSPQAAGTATTACCRASSSSSSAAARSRSSTSWASFSSIALDQTEFLFTIHNSAARLCLRSFVVCFCLTPSLGTFSNALSLSLSLSLRLHYLHGLHSTNGHLMSPFSIHARARYHISFCGSAKITGAWVWECVGVLHRCCHSESHEL